MIYISQTPNQTYLEGPGGVIVFAQHDDRINIIATSGDIGDILPIVLAFPVSLVTHTRVNCPDNVAIAFASAGFTVYTDSLTKLTTFTRSQK